MPQYQPNIPTGTVDLNIDYQNLQGNFQVLQSTYGIDHIPFANSTPAVTGYHKDIHFNPVSTTATNPPNNYVAEDQYPAVAGLPPVVAGIGQLFSSQVNDTINLDTGLYWLSGNGNKVALTRNFVPSHAASGSTFLPGGLILQWGTTITTTSSVPTPFNWPRPFTTFYSATLTVIATSTSDVRVASFFNNPTATQASVFVMNENGARRVETVFFIAIGV